MLSKDNGQPRSAICTYDFYIVGEQIRSQMNKIGMIKDRRYRLRKYRKCFEAKEAIDWLVRMCHAQSRGEAIMAMRCLQEHGMIHHVVDDHDFKDQNLFFRFSRDDDSHLLRSDLTAFYKGLQVFNRVKDSGIRREFYHRGHLYQGAFYGNDLVDCIIEQRDHMDRPDVIAECRELLEYDVIKHVTDDYHFSDDRLMYVFRVDYDRPCLLADVLHHPSSSPLPAPLLAPRTATVSRANVDQAGSSVNDNHQHNSNIDTPPDFHSTHLDQHIDEDDDNDDDDLDNDMNSSETRKTTEGGRGKSRANIMAKRVVKLEQDEMGYGFVLRGNSPCFVQSVDPLGPAAAAGLKEGHFVLSVCGENVREQDHRQVGHMVMTRSGLLSLTVLVR